MTRNDSGGREFKLGNGHHPRSEDLSFFVWYQDYWANVAW